MGAEPVVTRLPNVGKIRTVAIDGPAGAGKSTLAKALAEHLGLERLDTGAMYRAVAWSALHRGVDLSDIDAIGRLCRSLEIVVGSRVLVDGHDATEGIRTPEVDAAVSLVAANPQVRRDLVARQRLWVENRGGGVVEGRDISKVVLPEADLKIYLTASTRERALRRAKERSSSEQVSEIEAQISHRDHLDSSRSHSPMQSEGELDGDVLFIDSTGRSLESVVEEVLGSL